MLAKRIRFIGIIVPILAALYIARLYYIQIAEGLSYKREADAQYESVSAPVFDRGGIYFTTKNGRSIPAATLGRGYTVAVNPIVIKNPEDTFNLISNVLPISEEDFMMKVNKNDPYEVIANRVDEKTKEKISSLNISGLEISKENWRLYPGETLAAHILGFVGYNSKNEFAGRYGLEQSYDDILIRGGSNTYVNFFAALFSDIKIVFSNGINGGGDVITSIEPTVESELENQLGNIFVKYHTALVGGIIMNPKTGEIYAMGSLPTFDPNNPGKSAKETVVIDGTSESQSVFIDPLVEDRFEMGSIVKPIAMSIALEAGKVTPETKYNDTGFVMINGKKVSNYDGRAHGVIDMQTVLSDSLNVGMAYVESRTGREIMRDGFLKFGLSEKTGVDLPGEVASQVSNLYAPRDLELANASFGQGIALTPLQTIRALSALANNGILPNPHIVSKIEYQNGEAEIKKYEKAERAVSTSTAETITNMLVNVDDKALLNGAVKLEHYSVAAKTGTAQIAIPRGGGYYPDRYLHSFFGYFPAHNPRFIIFLFAVNPKGELYASHTLTYPFINIVKFLISYYNVPPDR